jgi:hypothetical protein
MKKRKFLWMMNLLATKMLRNKPTLSYCGLTVVLSNPSRHDKINLLSSLGGDCFNNFCLQPEFNQAQCDVRLMEDKSPWLEGTRCILLCGEAAMWEYTKSRTGGNTLNEMRGTPLMVDGIPAFASFFPQDCADYQNLEGRFNPLSKSYNPEGEDDDEEDDDKVNEKEHGRTKRSNYAFWLRADVRKCKRILLNEPSIRGPSVNYVIYPNADRVIQALDNSRGMFLEFDIETDYEEQNLLCFAFAHWSLAEESITVYSVPVLNHEYKWAYPNVHQILKSLSHSFSRNIVSGWNIAAFDLLVMAMKYSILPGPQCYDGMIAMHRCFPDVEKSLAHGTSYWTDEPFHKDMDSQSYFTKDHMLQKLKYCAKDVYTGALIHREIERYAHTIPGLPESIKCGMDSIRPYLICSLVGIKYDEAKRLEISRENDLLMNQYDRIIKLLIGPDGMAECKRSVKSKRPSMFASSNSQCIDYFYSQLGYNPVGRKSPKTGKPSLGKKNLFTLALKHDNPVITFTNLFRTAAKEYSSLKFYPFRDDTGKITKYVEPEG